MPDTDLGRHSGRIEYDPDSNKFDAFPAEVTEAMNALGFEFVKLRARIAGLNAEVERLRALS
jgi:uncharacterized small protein (DUF1192 family)